MKLAEAQTMLASALVQRQPSPEAARLACGSAKLSALDQVEVYREQFWLRHLACLSEDFPTAVALLGAAAFKELCVRYLAAFPPTHFMLRKLGVALGQFIAESEGDPLLAEIVRVEWAFIDAFDADDAPLLDGGAIAAATDDDWPLALIGLHPSITLLDLTWPADDLREAHAHGSAVFRPDPAPRCLVVHRRSRKLYAERVSTGAFAVLVALARGETLEAACTHADDAEEKIGEWLAQWTAFGWIASVTFPSRTVSSA